MHRIMICDIQRLWRHIENYGLSKNPGQCEKTVSHHDMMKINIIPSLQA